jgi:hypothetical protein
MPKSKMFCVAVAGTTVDGREIKPEWINDMAAGYVPATYSARVNMEHIRGYSADAPFNAYGTVTALEARDINLTIDGKSEVRRALFAEIDATDSLVKLNRDKQKLFTSVEINPNFAGTGKAYLVGLAVTDSPASLGTELLQFTSKHSGNVVTSATDAAIEFDAPSTETEASTSAFSAMAAFFTKLMSGTPAPAAPVVPVVPVTPTTPAPANDNEFATQMREGLGLINASIVALSAKVDTDVGALRTEFGTLKSELGKTELPGFSRQPVSGGGNVMLADC